MTSEFPEYQPPERIADAVIHVIGVTLAPAAAIVLLATALPRADLTLLVGLGIYAVGLVAMLTCSALYNLTDEPAKKRLYRRLDHAAIFLMIAATYTPFTLISLGGAWGVGILTFVWTVAIAGMAIKLLGIPCPDALLTATYFLLGWTIIVAFEPLMQALSSPGLTLLVAGGVLYTVGAVFHHWRGLPFQNAIWHAFVFVAASCHYLAVLHEVTSV
jgi:hemolysin III